MDIKEIPGPSSKFKATYGPSSYQKKTESYARNKAYLRPVVPKLIERVKKLEEHIKRGGITSMQEAEAFRDIGKDLGGFKSDAAEDTTKNLLKQLRKKYNLKNIQQKKSNVQPLNKNLIIQIKNGPDGKPFQVVSRREQQKDPALIKYLKYGGKKVAMSIFGESKSSNSVVESAQKNWFTYAGMEKAGGFGVSGKIENVGEFAGGGAKSGDASAKDQFGNKSSASISAPKPGTDFRSAGSGIPLAPMSK